MELQATEIKKKFTGETDDCAYVANVTVNQNKVTVMTMTVYKKTTNDDGSIDKVNIGHISSQAGQTTLALPDTEDIAEHLTEFRKLSEFDLGIVDESDFASKVGVAAAVTTTQEAKVVSKRKR